MAATGAATNTFSVSYFHGTTNITAAVVAGTFRTPTLATSKSYGITVKVLVRSNAPAGASVVRLVTAASPGPGSRRDTVKVSASRR